MRDVAVVSFAASAVAQETKFNEVEIIVPVIRDAIAGSGIPKSEIGFVCSGSIDYLFGGPFAFVAGVDAVGAVPPIRESHVEMDAAWALYEAWCYIQTGEIDSALIYGFSKGSIGDPYEILTMQTDPYYTIPLWPSMTDMAALQARAFLERTGRSEADLAEVAARAQRNGASTPYAVRADASATAAAMQSSPYVSDPLRATDQFPVSDGAVAVVIAADDTARRVSERPAWIRGIDHRIECHALGARDLSRSTSAALAAQHAGVADGPIDLAELHAQYSSDELILAEALGLGDDVAINPSGGPLVTNVIMAAGLARIGEAAARISRGDANRAVAHATSGPLPAAEPRVRPRRGGLIDGRTADRRTAGAVGWSCE
jgi:acetyl-CoA acetyltransferase